MPAEAEQLYGKMIETVRAETVKIARDRGMEPRAVAEVIGTALTTSKPRTRYLVGRDAKVRARVAKVMPDRMMDRAIVKTLSGES
jgi:hypothetical protein